VSPPRGAGGCLLPDEIPSAPNSPS